MFKFIPITSFLALFAAFSTTYAQEATDESSGNTDMSSLIEKSITERKNSDDPTLEEDDASKSANFHYSAAKNFYDGSIDENIKNPARVLDLNQARDNLIQALKIKPDHQEAQTLLVKVNAALGVPEDIEHQATKSATNFRQARQEQVMSEIENRYQKAKKAYDQKNYPRALREFERLLDELEFAPYDIPLKEYRQQVIHGLEATKEALNEEEKERALKRSEQAKIDSMKIIQREQDLLKRKIENYYKKAQIHFEAHEYMKTINTCKEILKIVPQHEGAKTLIEESEKRYKSEKYLDTKELKEHSWRLRELADRELYISYNPNKPMRFPKDYKEIVARHYEKLFHEQQVSEDEWKTNIRAKLKEKADKPYEGQPFTVIIKDMSARYDVSIDYDLDAVGDEDPLINLPVLNMKFEHVLEMLIDRLGNEELTWGLKHGGIYIAKKADFNQKSTLAQYDVRDLIATTKDFKGPDISLVAGDEAGITIEETDPDDDGEGVTGEDLVELIKETIKPESWDVEPHNIDIRNGAIVVNNEPSIHRDIQDMLSFMRKQRALQVSVQTRFLRVFDQELNHFGVDWAGLDSAANANNLEEITSTFSSPTPGDNIGLGFMLDTNPNISRFNSRGRLQSFLGNGYDLIQNSSSNALDIDTGGAFAIQFLDGIQLSALIRAMHYSKDATLVVAPMVTCFNTQRANVSVLQQEAYVRDLTAVVQVSVGIFDPEIGYVQSGTTLDVRPIVSHDRKYITLELRPTIAELTNMATININAAGIAGASSIQAPELTFRAIRTTVSVPDGGTLLMGGYSTGQEIDDYMGVPILSKLPILNSLLGSNVRSRERVNHYMLVKAQIIDQTEIEEDEFGVE